LRLGQHDASEHLLRWRGSVQTCLDRCREIAKIPPRFLPGPKRFAAARHVETTILVTDTPRPAIAIAPPATNYHDARAYGMEAKR
jgi:hypothetical protein